MEPIVIIDDKEIDAQPGVPLVVGARVKNSGTRNTAYDLEVVGIPSEWVQITPGQVRPREREADAAATVLTITIPMGPDAPSGTIPFGLKATATVDGSSAVDEGILHVGGAGGLDVIPEATQKTGRWRAKFPVVLENTGNSEIRLALVPFDPSDETILEMDREIVNLAPNAQTHVRLAAKFRSPTLRGAPTVKQLSLAVHRHELGADMKRPGQPVTPGQDPLYRNIPLMLTQSPILSKGVMALAALVVLGAVAIVGYRTAIYEEPTPTIAAPARGPDITFEPQPGGVTISWVPANGAESHVLQFAGSTDTEIIPAGTNSIIRTELDPGTVYRVSLRPIVGEDIGPATEFEFQPLSTTLDPPTGVSATPTGTGAEFSVVWSYPDPEATFEILVDGQTATSVAAGFAQTVVTLAPGTRDVRVVAIAGDTKSTPSAPLAVEVEAPADTGGGGDSVSAGGEGGGGGGGGAADGGDAGGVIVGDSGTGGESGGVTANGNDSGDTAGESALAARPFAAVLDVIQAAGAGVEGQSPSARADNWAVLLTAIPDVPAHQVLAIPAASFQITLPGGSPGPNDGQGFLIGAFTASEGEAAAICANQGVADAALSFGEANFAASCVVVEVSSP